VDSGATPNRHPFDIGGVRPGVVGLRQELNIYNLLGDPTVKLRLSKPWVLPPFKFELVRERVIIKLPPEPCLNCPRPEWLAAVAFEPKTGQIIGRTLLDDGGNGEIDLGGYKGPVWVRVSSPDGNAMQAADREEDSDGDGVPDSRDNCIAVPNRDQLDSDGDGYGNACDADLNNDGIVNSVDLALFRAKFGSSGRGQTDLNGDGVTNAVDLAIFRRLFAGRPGPSAWHTTSR
jgi:hypothetical protein